MLSIHMATQANLKYLHCKCSSLNDSSTKPYEAKKVVKKNEKGKTLPTETFSIAK